MNLCLPGRYARVAAALLFSAAAATQVSAQTLQLKDSSATVLRGGSYANKNLSSEKILSTRASSDKEYVRRVLLKFDTHNTIPARASIASAKLTLTVAGGNGQTRKIAAYRVTMSYDETAATWNRRKSGTSWSKAGGDLAEQYGTQNVTDSVGSRVTYDVTALVQGVVSGKFSASSRYTRLLLVDTGSSSRDSYKEYFSDEAADASVRPTLTVTLGAAAAPAPEPAPVAEPDSVVVQPDPEPEPSSSTSTLKVLQWNIKHGINLSTIASWIAKWKPDVISLNEVEKNNGYGSIDQAKVLADKLRAATGITYYVHFAQRYGSWSSNGQGNAILSRYRFASTGRETLSYGRSLAIATIVVNGRNVTVMSAHLDADSTSRRETQVRQIQSIASSWSEPRIVAGDFNAWPDHRSIAMMGEKYYDSWALAAKAGTASSFSGNSPFGATKNGRIDYIWHSHGSTALKVKSVKVPDTRNSSGNMPSDHRPVLTTYEVR
jgi:endonuclease/exonuclease/phosphatase family metal-dependent hydrolase